MYSGYQSFYAYSNVDVKVGLVYVAPQFVMKQKVGRCGIEEKFDIGYFKYRESAKGTSASLSGVGYDFLFGAEYYLSDHVGIGANIGYIGGSLPKRDFVEYKKDEHSGVSVYTLMRESGFIWYPMQGCVRMQMCSSGLNFLRRLWMILFRLSSLESFLHISSSSCLRVTTFPLFE